MIINQCANVSIHLRVYRSIRTLVYWFHKTIHMRCFYNFWIGLFCLACTSGNTYTISGTLPDSMEGREILLLSRTGKGADTLACINVNADRTFTLHGVAMNKLVHLVMGRFHEHLLFYAEPGKYVLEEADGHVYLIPEDSLARQSKITDFARRTNQNMEAIQKLQERTDRTDEEKGTENEKLWQQKQALVINILHDFKGTETAIAIATENMWIADYDFNFFASLVEAMGEVPESEDWQAIMKKYRDKDAQQLRGGAPVFRLPDIHDKVVESSDYKGKYLLIDFWASWCKPCRVKSKQLKRVYSHLQESGVEVVAISCDKEKKQWLKAIEEDQPLWTQLIADTKVNGSDVLKDYKVNSFPTLYLISPAGDVVAINPTIEEVLEAARRNL